MKKMTKRLACLVLVLVMACCALPGVTYGATTSVDLNQNYLFRARTNAFSFGAGETANLTFTPQYTAEYTLKLYGHVTGGRNIRASLTNPDGTVTAFEYPNRTGFPAEAVCVTNGATEAIYLTAQTFRPLIKI